MSENTEAFVDPVFLPEVTFSDGSKGRVRINDPTKMSVDHRKACLKKWYEIGYFEMRRYKPRNRKAQEPLPSDECWWAMTDASDTGAAAKKMKRRKKQKSRQPTRTPDNRTSPTPEPPIANLGSRGSLLLKREGISIYNRDLKSLDCPSELSDPEDAFPEEMGEDDDYPGISPQSVPSSSEGRAQWSLLTLNAIRHCSDSELLANAVKKLALLPVCTRLFTIAN
jgi:hypothetical protein